MIIWMFLYIFVLFLSILYDQNLVSNRKKNYILILLALGLIYFVGYRDGLGQDYANYVHRANIYNILPYDWIFGEPISSGLLNFCYETKYSEILFFLVMATITIVPIVIVYSRYKYFAYAMLVYLTLPGFFMSSFNIVRQTAVASIFLLSIYLLIEHNKKLLFFILIVIGFFIHKSALVLLPLFFLTYVKRINIKLLIIIILISFFIGNLIARIPYVSDLLILLDYDIYLDYDETSVSKFSTVNILSIVLVIYSLYNYYNKRYNNRMWLITIIISSLYIVCNNLSAGGFPIMYRIGAYFAPFIPLLVVLTLRECNLVAKEYYKVYVISFMLLFSSIFFWTNSDNELIVPEKMRPLEEIFDKK